MSKDIQVVLFVIVTVVAVIGTAAVGLLGYADTNRIVEKLYDRPQWSTKAVLDSTSAEQPLLVRLYGALELDSLDARNSRAATQLATRTWLRFLTSIFGGILIIFGAAFVLGRINAGAIDASGGTKLVNATLRTTSPGIVLAAFGVFLVSFPLWSTQEITTWDGASFGTLVLTEGPDGPVATLGPRVAAAAAVPVISAEEARKQLAQPEEGK